MSRTISLRLDLMDQQLIDAEERPVGRVDELELEIDEDGAARVVALRTGGAALGPRIGWWVGGVLTRSCDRLAEHEASPPLPISDLEHVHPRLQLTRPLRELLGVAGLEGWLGVRLVSRIPGGGDARV